MADAKSHSEQWYQRLREWEIAFHLAQAAQNQIDRAMFDFYRGTAPVVTLDQINRVDELWVSETRARMAMNGAIREVIGLASESAKLAVPVHDQVMPVWASKGA